MAISTIGLSPQGSKALNMATRLNALVSDEARDEIDWQNLGLMTFEEEWENPDDAIYDNWRELYGVSAR